ncbi:MAG: hypothetical protein BWZ02_03351 [Lentisphaerae bacterium ADurb.BinA184]|nr:MAG: hypothetical protein BWZ02_03351 [Lentisphaerae bacterium ADurb.BinA184]
MFRVPRLCIGAIAAMVLAASAPSHAATVNLDLQHFDRSQLVSAQTAMAGYMAGVTNAHVETFEGYKPWPRQGGTQNLRHTAVGRFTPTGKAGSGDAVVGQGSKLQVRNDGSMPWGRYNTANTPALPPGVADGNWLDSNDNKGMKWTIKGVGSFNTLAFYVLDAADVGGKFSIKVGDKLYKYVAGENGRLANGNIHLVQINLDEAVDRLTIRLRHNIINDGFGIDGAVVGTLSPVPLPAGILLLAPGLALLGVPRLLARRRDTAA